MRAQQAGPTSLCVYTFGETATFSLTFPAEPRPAEVHLFIRIPGQSTHGYAVPLNGLSATLTRDLAATPLPPFAEIAYWWDYTTPDGTRIETGKQSLVYLDNRYTWQSVSEQAVTLHWIAGEKADLVRGLDIALEALAEIQWALQASQTTEVDIYAYPSQPDLLSAMQVSGLEWAGGGAFPELGVVLVVVPPTTDGLLNMARDIPHELAHKVLYDALGPQGYASLPTWLVEGFAAHFEARPNPDYALVLSEAHRSGTLLPLSDLCAPFPDDAHRALLAYAESASFVNYLRQTYGWSGIRDLLRAYTDGMACSTGTQAALDTDLAQLDWDWRVWLQERAAGETESPLPATLTVLLRDAGPWLLLFGVLVLPGLILVITRRR